MAKLYNHNAVLQAENRSLRALVRGRHSWNRVPASDNFAVLSEDAAAKAQRETEEVLDRMRPNWRTEVGYGL
jgi:hypothetical protein